MKKIINHKKSLFIVAVLLFCCFINFNIAEAVDLGNSLQGRILLQVEQNGEAWYINPANKQGYYMGRPSDAFDLMRNLGVGITNTDLRKIPVAEENFTGTDTDKDGLSDMIEDSFGTDKNNADTDGDGYNDKTEILGGYNPMGSEKLLIDNNLINSQRGKILLQVEQNGEAWYVYPADGKRYFLGRPADAFNIMRKLGLGITDANLENVTVYKESSTPDPAPEPTSEPEPLPTSPEGEVDGGQAEPTPEPEPVYPTRESKIPEHMVKITPATDGTKPILHSSEFKTPVPVRGVINTAGAEDSPFMMPDGKTFFVWFTPDPNISANKQLSDGVTGIYSYEKVNGEWVNLKRVMLQDEGEVALDGCQFVQGNKIWFCSARAGFTGLHWFTAEQINGKWQNWQDVGFGPDYEVGELHITDDGQELYFHSPRAGGLGEYDIWMSKKSGDAWQTPIHLEAVNTEGFEGWPYVNHAKNELWFTRIYLGMPAIYRSKKVNGDWQEPELIISHFAGEPTFDEVGNLYFAHHYYKDNKMLEADIYVAEKK